jgi:hypothetical protein
MSPRGDVVTLMSSTGTDGLTPIKGSVLASHHAHPKSGVRLISGRGARPVTQGHVE